MISTIERPAPVVVRMNNWRNIGFFAFTTLGALVGVPVYLSRHGFVPGDWILFGVYVIATGMSITAGYHRLYAHRAWKAHPVVGFLALFFGAAAFEQAALDWATQHRDHHKYVDTPEDPYSIKRGFFYAHMGWLLFYDQPLDYGNVKDLKDQPMVAHQKRYYLLWCLASGIFLPLAIGAAYGSVWGALWIGICLRIFVVHHSTFFINSVCHTFGTSTYDPDATARDHWLVAILTNGEGYHNFHHRFPSDYRNGVRWYHWDPTKWLIASLAALGLARDLKKTPDPIISEVRLQADTIRARRRG